MELEKILFYSNIECIEFIDSTGLYHNMFAHDCFEELESSRKQLHADGI